LRQHRQQQRREEANDANDHEHLHQGEAIFPLAGSNGIHACT